MPKEDPLALVGTTIAEKYAVESVVGEGGFAIVYRANHTLWNRAVAVKVFRALGEVAAEHRKKLLDDFIQEGALLAALSERSTAIVQARDVGMLTTPAGDTVPYMVLEWLDGQTLEALLEGERAESAPLRSLVETVRLLEPAAEALALAHKQGIAHRDVKPANVFVVGDPRSPEATVKLLDFGIAKVVQDAQKMGFGKTAGHITSFTPLYGAPEQFDRRFGATGPWTDVFALALVVAEVVSGREPLTGDSLLQLAFASSDENRRPTPQTLGVVCSPDVDAVFRKAVAVKPEDRYQTAGEFWIALKNAVTDDPVSSRSPFRSSDRARLVATDGELVDGVGATALAPEPLPMSARDREPAAPLPSKATTNPSPTHETSRPEERSPAPAPTRSKAPVIVGLSLAVLAVGGAGMYQLRARSSGTVPAAPSSSLASASAAPPASPSGSASSAPTAAACPAGMLLIPGGSYFMGSDEPDALPFEKPAHPVRLSPFCIDELEVTVEAYKACSDRGACKRAGRENVWPGILPAQQKIYDPLCNIRDPEAKAKHPINCVDWEQARTFCEARDARLPTEAEWELAARGPDGRVYPWGDALPSAEHLNACGNECLTWMRAHPDPTQPPSAMYDQDDGFPNTAPVGSFPKGKSRYGVQDVVGNVWEWVADFYGDYDVTQNAPALTDPKGPQAGTERVIRGGAWNGSQPSWVRPSFRYHAAPSARSYGFGFRCAKSP